MCNSAVGTSHKSCMDYSDQKNHIPRKEATNHLQKRCSWFYFALVSPVKEAGTEGFTF